MISLFSACLALEPAPVSNMYHFSCPSVAGLGLSWLQNNLGLLSDASESEALAASVEDTAGCYFVPGKYFSNRMFEPH